MIRHGLVALLACLLLAGSVHSQEGKGNPAQPAKGISITLNPDGTITIGTGQQKQNLIPLTDEQINALRVLQSIKLPEIPKKDVLTPKPAVKETTKSDGKDKKDGKDKIEKDGKDKNAKDGKKKGSARLDAIEKESRQTSPESRALRGPLVVVKLPPKHEKATVYFDGAGTKSEGLVREYKTDPIYSIGEQYYYEVVAIINGRIQRRDAIVRNNATTTVDFTVPQ